MYITQGLKRSLQVNRNGTATIDGARQRTWGEFAERVARFAGALQYLELERDGRVAILSFNSDYYLECFFAVQWAGGIIVPLNIRLAVAELVYMLNDAGATILIVDETFAEMLPALLAGSNTIEHVIFAADGEPPAQVWGYEELLDSADPIPDAERGHDDIAGILYTGGTTGLPKGVMLTHTNLVSNAMTAMLSLYEGTPWNYLHSAPMFHIADAQFMVSVTLHAGTHVFMPKFVPEDMLKVIEHHGVTHCALVPTMVNMLVNLSNRDQYDVSTLRRIHYGGSPMPAALIGRARKAFPNCLISQGYGQTETAPNVSILADKFHDPDGPYADKIESAGQSMLTVEVKIHDLDDNELPVGETGEVVVRGPNIMKGYWNKPDETAAALRDGWMHTGDIGYLDEDGFLYVIDRLKDMIVTGGENVYSAEVEAAIYQHSAVAMCAVIGIPDDKWGESIHAIVIPRDGETMTEEGLIAHCRNLIAGFKCPRSVEIRHEPMPMSGAGKILKRALREPFWEGKSRSIN
jgi:long-chain acyl-CoA synthetase